MYVEIENGDPLGDKFMFLKDTRTNGMVDAANKMSQNLGQYQPNTRNNLKCYLLILRVEKELI